RMVRLSSEAQLPPCIDDEVRTLRTDVDGAISGPRGTGDQAHDERQLSSEEADELGVVAVAGVLNDRDWDVEVAGQVSQDSRDGRQATGRAHDPDELELCIRTSVREWCGERRLRTVAHVAWLGV